MEPHACPICGHVADSLDNICTHQRVAVLQAIDEMALLSEADEYDEETMKSDYDEWAAANPEDAATLHQEMVEVVERVLDKLRKG